MSVVRIQPSDPAEVVGHAVWEALEQEFSATGHDASHGALLIAFDSEHDAAEEVRRLLVHRGWADRFVVQDFSDSPT